MKSIYRYISLMYCEYSMYFFYKLLKILKFFQQFCIYISRLSVIYFCKICIKSAT
jgi:hypothetical protein